MSLTIQHRRAGARRILVLDGVLDLQTRGQLLSAGTRTLDELAAGGELAIELAAVSFVDSSGLGVLVELMNRGRGKDVPVVMCNPSGPVATLFTLTALDRAFTIETGKTVS